MNVKTIKKFIIGSRAFFSGIKGYAPKDKDELCIIDYPIFGDNVMYSRRNGYDIFMIYNYGKEKLIEQCIKINVPLGVGKFLVPEFAEYINMNIDDLKQLESLLNNIDEKHSYEKIIYNAYIENGSFTLTDEQRMMAYNKYMEYKKT